MSISTSATHPNANSIVSPFATGGGGVTLHEQPVNAYYLALLLLGAVPRGLSVGITREVRLQRFFDGEWLDDLIVIADHDGGEGKLSLQLKHDMAFGEKDENFEKVIKACWQTFKASTFNPSLHHFGVGVGKYKAKYDEYQTTLSWARNSSSADDFYRRISTQRLSSAGQREIVELIDVKLSEYEGRAITIEEVWRFLRSFVLLDFDFTRPGSRDTHHIEQMLQTMLPAEHANRAPVLWNQLLKYAGEGGPAAGSYNAATLRERLLEDGFHADGGTALIAAPDCRADLRKLQEATTLALDDIRTDIAGVELNRTNLLTQAQAKLRDAAYLILTGEPGIGKSALWKSLVQIAQGEGPVLVLSESRMIGPGWNGFARHLNLQRELHEILLALSGNAHPTLFIDGLDRVSESSSQTLVNDLLRGIEKMPADDGKSRWRVVATSRAENLKDVNLWLDPRVSQRVQRFEIPELEPDEVQVIASSQARLRPLLSVPSLQPILRRPFLFSLVADPLFTPEDAPLPEVSSEIEVCNEWWQRFVGRDYGIGRKQTLLKVGEYSARAPGKWLSLLSLSNVSPQSLDSLRADRILIFDTDNDRLRILRDPLEEWVLYRVLNNHRDDLIEYVKSLEQPLGLLRPMQLLGAFLLEHYSTHEEWQETLTKFESQTDLPLRWQQAMLTAPLASTRSLELLQKAEPVLLEDNARRLIELLVALRTVEVEPDNGLLPFIQTKDPTIRQSIVREQPLPRITVWLRLLHWLVPRANEFPDAARPEIARIFAMWQRATSRMSDDAHLQKVLLRREIAELAFAWLEPIQSWREEGDEELFT